MAQTYQQIQKQIQQLQQQAELLRSKEIKGVVERIKVAIAHYGLTAAHLGLESASGKSKTVSKAKTTGKSKARFGDGNGAEWSGRGPHPHWLRDALKAGRSIEEFRLGVRAKGNSAVAESAPIEAAAPINLAVKKTKTRRTKKLYSDGAGNTWSGMGPKPKWLRLAIEGGKTMEDFAQ